MYVDMMHSSANNGHHPHHPSHHPPTSHPPPPSHLDSRYMDYATAAMAAAPHHTAHLGPHDPHALHYAAAVSLPPQPHLLPGGAAGNRRHPDGIGMENYGAGGSSDEDGSMDVKPPIAAANPERAGTGRGQSKGGPDPSTGKKTKGRVKIKMEFIDNKLRRYTTFSKRKTGIMKKAYELSTLTGTQVMLLVASETGHVYTFATRKLQPMITSDAGKALIQTCLNSPDPPPTVSTSDQRMSATGYEETELTYNIADDEQQKVRQMMYNSHYSAAAASASAAVVAAHQHSHNLFPPTSVGGVGPPGGHMNANITSHSPYGSHPASSPSPSHHGSYGGVSISPGPTHHSPPFATPLSQHSR